MKLKNLKITKILSLEEEIYDQKDILVIFENGTIWSLENTDCDGIFERRYKSVKEFEEATGCGMKEIEMMEDAPGYISKVIEYKLWNKRIKLIKQMDI